MRDLSPAALICAVLSGLLGLAQVFRLWDSKEPCASVTRRNFLLAFYFTVYFVAILILFFEVTSSLAPQSLFELSWLNGFCVEAVFLQRNFSIPEDIRGSLILRILVVLIAAAAGLLQGVGFAISFSDAGIKRYLAFAGARLLHVSAAVFFIFPLKYKIARHRKPVLFALIYTFAAVGGFCFIPISNGDIFLLANCILECVVNFVLLASAQIKSQRLRNDNPKTEDTAGNAERSNPLRIEVAETVSVYVERYGLPTPPPSPVPSKTFVLGNLAEHTAVTTADNKDIEASRCSILDITVSETCVVHARVLAQWATPHGKVLRLITMDWKNFSHYWGLQLVEHIGKTVYDMAERLSSGESGAGMVLLTERDLCDVGLSLEDCKSLLDGFGLYISSQVVLADIPWMSSCEGCHN